MSDPTHYVLHAPGVDVHHVPTLTGTTLEVAGHRGTHPCVVIGDTDKIHALNLEQARLLLVALVVAIGDAT